MITPLIDLNGTFIYGETDRVDSWQTGLKHSEQNPRYNFLQTLQVQKSMTHVCSISNTFAEYYSNLYNLSNDGSLPPPTGNFGVNSSLPR